MSAWLDPRQPRNLQSVRVVVPAGTARNVAAAVVVPAVSNRRIFVRCTAIEWLGAAIEFFSGLAGPSLSGPMDTNVMFPVGLTGAGEGFIMRTDVGDDLRLVTGALAAGADGVLVFWYGV